MSDESAGRGSRVYREHRPWQDLDTMLAVEEARARILASVTACDSEPVKLVEAHGLVLAEDVVAREPVPRFRNSAMDGYAVRFQDVQDADFESPVRLKVVGNLPAGVHPAREVRAGQAIRIMTGAAMPVGADTVVRFEETSEADSGGYGHLATHVLIRRATGAGANVRLAGEDIAAGSTVLKRGTVLHAAELGILASVDRTVAKAIRRPVVGILATGDEVIDPGDPIRPGQIRNSNNFMLAGMVKEAGAYPLVLGVARDSADDIRTRLAEASECDLIITSGGVSVGDYDVVKDVLQAEGQIDLWQVRIKPGKPMAFGRINDIPLIGLPGNPVAAYVAFLQFATPALRRMRGLKDAPETRLSATLVCEHENRGHRRHFVRGRYFEKDQALFVEPVTVQGSGVLTSVATANCLFVIPEELDHAPAGLTVDLFPIRRYD